MPAEWRTMTLGELITLQRGHDLTAEERKPGRVPVMGAAGHNGYHDTALAKAPGIVMGRSGGSFGQVHLAEEDFWPHNTALYVTDFKGNDPHFVFYLLRTIDFSRFNSGSAQPSLNRNFVYPLPVRVPHPVQQRRIASVLSALDDKIALNTRINAELEAMAKLLYDYWFVQFDFPNAKGKPYKSSGGAMVHNTEVKREVPDGWEVKPLERMAHLIMGQSPKGASYNTEGKGMPLVNGAADYRNGMLAPETWTSEPTRTCIKDDLVFCSRATIGNLTIAEDTFCIGRCISAVRPTDPKATEFLFFGLLNELERFKRQAPGSIIKGITRDDLRDAPFLTPGGEVLKRFHEAAFPMFQKIRLNKVENQELTTLRDWLLPMLMNGQVVLGEAEEKVGLAMAAEPAVVYPRKTKP